jgi:hypothetical protein
LSGLIPGGVYSVFYRTFGPDSITRSAPNEERSRVLPEVCNGSDCPAGAESEVVASGRGTAHYRGRVEGLCLLDAETVLFDVIYHLNGLTYGELPNALAFQTQLEPCLTNSDCAAGDECNTDLQNTCQPIDCEATSTCRSCQSSFGNDAMRQAVIIQQQP